MNSNELFARINKSIDHLIDPQLLSGAHNLGFHSIFSREMFIPKVEYEKEVFQIPFHLDKLVYNLSPNDNIKKNIYTSKEWIKNIELILSKLKSGRSTITVVLIELESKYGKQALIDHGILFYMQGAFDHYEEPDKALVCIYDLIFEELQNVLKKAITIIESRIQELKQAKEKPDVFESTTSFDDIRSSYDLLRDNKFIDDYDSSYQTYKGIFVSNSFVEKVCWKENKASLRYFINQLSKCESIKVSKQYVTASHCFNIYNPNRKSYEAFSNKDIQGWQKSYNSSKKQILDKAVKLLSA